MPDSLYRLIYCSKNTLMVTGAKLTSEIEAILASARRNNVRRGITGALLFTQTGFAQVLEGQRDAVQAIFEHIQVDRRHSDVTVLSFLPTDRRSFPAWSMAYVGELSAGDSDTLAALALSRDDVRGLSAKGAEVLRMLEGLVVQESDAVFV